MSNALGPRRKSSVSRKATMVAECDSADSSDISPTVSPTGMVATRRRGPRSSSMKTPRLPVTTRKTARSFSPSRGNCVPPGRPNQSASASNRRKAGSPTSCSRLNSLSRARSDGGKTLSLLDSKGKRRAISPIHCRHSREDPEQDSGRHCNDPSAPRQNAS